MCICAKAVWIGAQPQEPLYGEMGALYWTYVLFFMHVVFSRPGNSARIVIFFSGKRSFSANSTNRPSTTVSQWLFPELKYVRPRQALKQI